MTIKIVLKAPIPDGLQHAKGEHVPAQYARTMQVFVCEGDAEMIRKAIEVTAQDKWFELKTVQGKLLFIRADNIAWIEE